MHYNTANLIPAEKALKYLLLYQDYLEKNNIPSDFKQLSLQEVWLFVEANLLNESNNYDF